MRESSREKGKERDRERELEREATVRGKDAVAVSPLRREGATTSRED